MCQFSATAETSRPAEQGEQLVISESPHGYGNWLTELGQPAVAVCILSGTILAVEVYPGFVRGARFEENDVAEEHLADVVVYLDGLCERMHLYKLKAGIKIQVLQLPGAEEEIIAIPAEITSTVTAEDLVLVGAH